MTARTVVERSDIQFSPPLKHLFSATWQQGAANILLKETVVSFHQPGAFRRYLVHGRWQDSIACRVLLVTAPASRRTMPYELH